MSPVDRSSEAANLSRPLDAISSTIDPADVRYPHHLVVRPTQEVFLANEPQDMSHIETTRNGDQIETRDERLSDAAALYDFLIYQSKILPKITIRCTGTSLVKPRFPSPSSPTRHRRRSQRNGDRASQLYHPACTCTCRCAYASSEYADPPEVEEKESCDTTTKHKPKSAPQGVGPPKRRTDFDFTIDISEIITQDPEQRTIWTPPNTYPTYRGSHWIRFAAESQISSLTDPGRCLGFLEADIWASWQGHRRKRGIPGWMDMSSVPDFSRGLTPDKLSSFSNSSKDPFTPKQATLREWCEAFSKNQGLLKEFWMTKEVSGWDFENLRHAIQESIRSSGYRLEDDNEIDIVVNVNIQPKYVVVKSNGWLSRALGNPFIYFYSWITGLYPLIYLFKCAFPKIGGAYWNVVSVDYALKSYRRFPTDSSVTADISASSNQGPPEMDEQYRMIGMKEGEWFKQWEKAIIMGVKKRFKGELDESILIDNLAARKLDGYAD
ncbi:uncharacterized protein I303_106832 [Kwoniella dejecticola CBS 10117]|uniref:Uncharacterized protein n=1 Tax=Kwoniella dejecticola CBS 10117 TaxID=1296121 RepID=A0A1A5ZTL1_9TREE|nr:uncharacterized protein I303_08526 [Kwoniella dejecticola CBS 10117]OBR81142.1 hypothetical protein I303_08526 [Kwoniella dejecticola CBS 10117]